MAGPGNKKRSHTGRSKVPYKKQKKQQVYNSDSEEEPQQEEQAEDFEGVNLLDSDDDIHNARVDDVGADEDGDSFSDSDSEPETKPTSKSKAPAKAKMTMKLTKKPAKEAAKDEDDDEDDEEEDDDDEDMEGDEFDINDDTDESVGDDEYGVGDDDRKPKKRNDPTAFATSLSKILSTKLSNSKRSDPVLARNAEAHEASKAAVDSALEAKAKRHLRDMKRKAMEKGRVKDVLVASNSETTGEPDMTTGDILALEGRLRKVAQRGVVKMFNAVRAAQVKSAEAEKNTKRDGVLGMGTRTEKVNEMTKKGFLDLIASGGGGLKKSGLEEA
ncbi:Putative DUF1665 domain-containing protein [[Torrubiella] hemipterigena]|uniref:Putative DUF1665 domain-containing protein n=1 Tax=[Torrubiella] hemipterigena TaxID=1531966 RepID=A0A0A1T650_9HYPO|nr:Putative DUF1665 domain-containing protein [[Torrubiella] hemipterigena]